MGSLVKILAAAFIGLTALGLTAAASAARYDARPAYCGINHDHRSHAANYYDYYAHDRYYRAGPYRSSGLNISVRLGGGNDYGYGDRYDENRYARGHRGHGARSRIVKQRTYDTRYRARIHLVEEARGRGRSVCTIDVRGPDARRVPVRRLRNIAASECSRRAQVRFV